ncbi:MAG: hypothetical protein HY774_29790 [Acidobacteria bacterium]|nr:hypothetical protein [Acidobacteriota bacterium]
MLELDNPRWNELDNAYDTFYSTQDFLRRLWAEAPNISSGEWADFLGSLCAGGQVPSASFAAIPHVIEVAKLRKPQERPMFMLAVCLVEGNRQRNNAPIPHDLEEAYRQAIEATPPLLLECLALDWESENLRILMATLAAIQGKFDVVELLIPE